MKLGRDLQAGDVVYDSNMSEWEKDTSLSLDGWAKTIAVSVGGEVFLTSHAKKTGEFWAEVACNLPQPDRKYGETPAEAMALDAAAEIEYHEERLTCFRSIARSVAALLTTPGDEL